MDTKKFKMRDEAFVCAVCKNKVEPLKYTARDHCPKCLTSLHVDNNPGDRLNHCRGILKPIDIEKYRDTYKIIYKCEKCGVIKKNIMASDDNFEAVLKIIQNKNI